MKLLIHDLSPASWEHVKSHYTDWTVVSEDPTSPIRPCVGCFSCWSRTPGQCVIKDGYDNIGVLFHRSDEVTVISRYTYGGFSSFVKNVFDRCIGYALPQLEVVDGETHHKKRYDEDKPFTFVFYGNGLSGSQKDSARRYVKAVCANIRWHVKDVVFKEVADVGTTSPSRRKPPQIHDGKIILLNGSMRDCNSAILANKLSQFLSKNDSGVSHYLSKNDGDVLHYLSQNDSSAGKSGSMREIEHINLRNHLNNLSLLMSRDTATDIVIATPLYVDGLPSQVIRLMETMSQEYRSSAKRVYVLANMGLYESAQLVNLFDAVQQWCKEIGFKYCGGLGVSAGEVIGVLMRNRIPFFTRNVIKELQRLAKGINDGAAVGELSAELFCFPRKLYIDIANGSWKRLAKANGIKVEDLYRRL